MWGGDLIDLTTIIKLIYCWCLLISNILVKIKKYNFSKLKSSVSIRSGFLRDTAYHFLVFLCIWLKKRALCSLRLSILTLHVNSSPRNQSLFFLICHFAFYSFSFIILPSILIYIYIYAPAHTKPSATNSACIHWTT